MFNRSYILLLTLAFTALALAPAFTQERTSGAIPTAAGAASTSQQSLSTAQKVNVTALAATLNNSCTDGGATYQHGTTWNTSCPLGSIGSVTKICLHGQAVIQSGNCKTSLPCGTHASGDTWTGACPTGTSGNMVYRCQDGNTVVDLASLNTTTTSTPGACQYIHGIAYNCGAATTTTSNGFTSCTANNCSGAGGTLACPTTSDGMPMSGTLTYSCSNNALSITNSTCSTYNKPCGTIPHGTPNTAFCSTYNSALGGNLNFYCNNGNNALTGMNCHVRQWTAFSVTLPGSSCDTGQQGIYNNQTVACNVGGLNLRTAIAAANTDANGNSITNAPPLDSLFSQITATVSFSAQHQYDANWVAWQNVSYVLGDLTKAEPNFGASSGFSAYYGNLAKPDCSGTNSPRQKAYNGFISYDGTTLTAQSGFGSEGAEAGGRHYHPGCQGDAAIQHIIISGYAFE